MEGVLALGTCGLSTSIDFEFFVSAIFETYTRRYKSYDEIVCLLAALRAVNEFKQTVFNRETDTNGKR